MITLAEVKSTMPAGQTFPSAVLCDAIPIAEENLVNECLGADLWDYLTSKLNTVDVSAAEDWQECGDYSTGDVVIRNDLFFESTADNNNTDPAESGSDWELVDKFTDSCANTLWNNYLKRALAFNTFYFALPLTSGSFGPNGMTIQGADSRGVRAMTISEISQFQTTLLQNIAATLKNMKAWAQKDEQKDCGFPSSAALGSDCADCSTSKVIAARHVLMK
ncbi:MAG: hypothetical protein KDC70_01170 [Saprospiraceae bacterium]|nr:hypothetical protein [Saprospiraceae bacterium]